MVPLAALAGVLAYALATHVLSGRSSSRPTALSACRAAGRPQVERVAPAALGRLRESIVRVLPQRLGRLYEEGTIESANAFRDGLPLPPPVSFTAPRPGGYEMRWWAPNGDDIVADVFQFASASEANGFLALATSTRCRLHARARQAPLPPDSHNLTWLNPDYALEADVYLRRGARVYRVVDVPPSRRGVLAGTAAITRAFLTVDTLACLLPQVRCTPLRPTVPV
jgi:hypothetical protein